MRYDSEADFERALMSIDHVVKSTLAKRANRGVELEQMDPGDMITALQSLYEWYDSIKDAIPKDVSKAAKQHIQAAWKVRGALQVEALEKVRQLLAPYRKTHPVLEKAAQAKARARRKRSWSPGQLAAFRKAQAKRKAAKIDRSKKRVVLGAARCAPTILMFEIRCL